MLFGGALRIQRLEGSRPGLEKNGLCRLNGRAEEQRGCEVGFMVRAGRMLGRTKRSNGLRMRLDEAAKIAGQVLRAR